MSRSITVEILGDSRSLEKAFQKSAKDAQKFSKGVQETSKHSGHLFEGIKRGAELATGALGIEGLAGAAGEVFDKFTQGQQAAAQTEAALKSTGGAAGVTAKQVDELALSIQNKTGIDDAAVHSGENLLLTFTGIRNEVGKNNDIFNRATVAVTDLATRMNHGAIPSTTQMKTASIQLGKALNDPIHGVTALRRVGIQFTDSQKTLIKRLVDTGHTLQAQKIILGEVRKEFGGSAVAAGKTLSGQLNILKQTALTLGATVLSKLMPSILHVVNAMTKWLQNSRNQKTIMDTLNGVIHVVTVAAKILKGAFDLLSKAVGGNKHAVELLVAAYATFKVAQISSGVAGLAGSFLKLGKTTETATAEAKGLSLAMKTLAGIGIITLGVELLIHKDAVDKAVSGFLDKHGLPGGTNTLTPQQVIRDYPQLRSTFGAATADKMYRQANRQIAAGGGIVVHGGLHVHGVQNPRQLQDAIVKASRSHPVRRRGDP